MARISTYTRDTVISDNDTLIGTDGDSNNATRNFSVAALRTYFQAGMSGSGGGSGTDTTLTNEQVQDIVGAMVSGNTETGITVTYDDDEGKLDFVVTQTQQPTTIDTFVELTDTPSALGTANQQIRVNSGGTALEFFTPAEDEAADQRYLTAVVNNESADRDLDRFTVYAILPPTGTTSGGGGTSVGPFSISSLTGRGASAIDIRGTAADLGMLQVGDTFMINALEDPTVTGTVTQLSATVSDISNAAAGFIQASVTPASTIMVSGNAPSWYPVAGAQQITFTRGGGGTTPRTDGGTYNMPNPPMDGDWVKISNLTGTNNVVLNAGTGFRFMNDSQDRETVTLNDSTATFELVYIADNGEGDNPVGWVFVGSE